ASHRTPRVFVGPIAAGEKVVASSRSAVARFVRKRYGDALAVEMEGRGCLRAIQANADVRALIVRGISDLLDRKAESDAAGGQERAAAAASAFAFEVLANLAPFPGRFRESLIGCVAIVAIIGVLLSLPSLRNAFERLRVLDGSTQRGD